jgi:hypothetical protein
MRAWRIITYIVAGTLLLAMGFSVGAICTKRASQPHSALKPIGPPEGLSSLGSSVWKLTSGLTVIEEFVWAMYEEEPTGITQPDRLVGHAYNTISNSNKLEDLFSGEHPEYQDDPEYWLERWLFWNYVARYMGPSSASEQETERGIHDALVGMKQFGETYAPITYRLCVDAGLSEKEENYYFDILHELQPDNGYIDVMLAAKLRNSAAVDELLELLKTAADKPEFRVPVAPLTEVLAEHWVKQGEVVSPMLAFRYTEADPRVPSLLGLNKAIQRITSELDDNDLVTALHEVKRALARLYLVEPPVSGHPRLSLPNIMLRLSRASTEAYVRAGNPEAVKQCRIQESRLSRLAFYATQGISLLDDFEGIIERGSGRSFRDTVVFSDFIRWLEFGDTERMDGLVEKYDEFEYPPLEPEAGAAEGGKAP